MRRILVKSALNKHRKRDSWFLDDYSVNPYSGCSFNCIYCYTRGSRYGSSEKGLAIKANLPEVLEKQLKNRARKGEYGIIAISTSTEPYQRIEEKERLTRKVLEIALKYRFPVHILTKSTLVLRDLDILGEIDERAVLPDDLSEKLEHKAIVNFSISTLDERVSRVLEPASPSPSERLEAMEKCREHGFFAGVSFIPVLPFISDGKKALDDGIREVKRHDGKFIFVGALTLFGEKPEDCKTLYYNFLKKHFPELIPRYNRLYRIHSQPSKEYQSKLETLAKRLCEKHGVGYKLL